MHLLLGIPAKPLSTQSKGCLETSGSAMLPSDVPVLLRPRMESHSPPLHAPIVLSGRRYQMLDLHDAAGDLSKVKDSLKRNFDSGPPGSNGSG